MEKNIATLIDFYVLTKYFKISLGSAVISKFPTHFIADRKEFGADFYSKYDAISRFVDSEYPQADLKQIIINLFPVFRCIHSTKEFDSRIGSNEKKLNDFKIEMEEYLAIFRFLKNKSDYRIILEQKENKYKSHILENEKFRNVIYEALGAHMGSKDSDLFKYGLRAPLDSINEVSITHWLEVIKSSQNSLMAVSKYYYDVVYEIFYYLKCKSGLKQNDIFSLITNFFWILNVIPVSLDHPTPYAYVNYIKKNSPHSMRDGVHGYLVRTSRAWMKKSSLYKINKNQNSPLS